MITNTDQPTDQPSSAPVGPNLFKLQGRTAQITYQTSSIAGQPQLTYKDSKVNRTFNGGDIRTQELEIGTLVNVTLQFNPDALIVTLSLLLPSINLKGRSTSFKTIAVVTTKRSGFTGVQPGARETYRTLPLEGTARLVEF